MSEWGAADIVRRAIEADKSRGAGRRLGRCVDAAFVHRRARSVSLVRRLCVGRAAGRLQLVGISSCLHASPLSPRTSPPCARKSQSRFPRPSRPRPWLHGGRRGSCRQHRPSRGYWRRAQQGVALLTCWGVAGERRRTAQGQLPVFVQYWVVRGELGCYIVT